MSPPGHLCMLCGSTLDPEIVAPGQGRCRDCGHGFSFTTLTASAPTRMSATDRKLLDAEERGRTRRIREQFDFASFEPHALDERWRGLRWIGGAGGSNGDTTRLELAHGDDPFDPNEPQVRVGTHRAASADERAMAWGHLAKEHVNEMWSATGSLSDDIRRSAFPMEFTGRDPTEPWTAADIAVDGVPVRFRVLPAGDRWFAQAHYGDIVLSITANRWPIERTGLVSGSDVTEYIAGTEEMRRRGQERHGGSS